jgi:hypothetical protein
MAWNTGTLATLFKETIKTYRLSTVLLKNWEKIIMLGVGFMKV